MTAGERRILVTQLVGESMDYIMAPDQNKLRIISAADDSHAADCAEGSTQITCLLYWRVWSVLYRISRGQENADKSS